LLSQKVEPFAITYFEDEVKKSPDNYLPKIMLAQAYLRDDKTFEARHIIEDLRKKYPNNTFLNIMPVATGVQQGEQPHRRRNY
jgi:predicted Zn-dependent protease